ncbi:hypothetical protein CROQUDRAFT_93976 [Cronartium quercuum f. sp. fusiforme G11]|uniref:Uncharacterized protein n=1 Tax=Cronartium quercuum f. sp. fusiforme G11 TaxID=708437 RepID=A0A9P6NG09_9BASI|nr:hypothetical protein CROQUDRAFT_93976 [Cronartium quercuum f. sp. fusiforme G11]
MPKRFPVLSYMSNITPTLAKFSRSKVYPERGYQAPRLLFQAALAAWQRQESEQRRSWCATAEVLREALAHGCWLAGTYAPVIVDDACDKSYANFNTSLSTHQGHRSDDWSGMIACSRGSLSVTACHSGGSRLICGCAAVVKRAPTSSESLRSAQTRSSYKFPRVLALNSPSTIVKQPIIQRYHLYHHIHILLSVL